MQVYPRVPASRDPLVDRGDLTTRAWFRFFSEMPGAVAQASLETYARVQNSTGSTIPKGTVVGFAGVGSNNVLSIAPYLADGSTPSLYILGVMDETLPDSGAQGAVCVWGHVTGIDTSAFNVGDVLYASPTVAGGFTNVKPTAPDNVIPLAAVLVKSATAGEVFVRPTIEQQKYYGQFSRTTNLVAAAINTAYAIPLTDVEIEDGVTLEGSPTTRLKVPESGLYQFSVRYQFTSSNASSKTVRTWFRRNGTTDYPDSTALNSLESNGAYIASTVSDFFSLQVNDYIELMWAVSNTALSLSAVPATAYAPTSASVLVSVTQIQQ
jgi:hypothetical protein